MRHLMRRLTYLWSFGRLLRTLRGTVPLETVAARAGLSAAHLRDLEVRRLPLDATSARSLLERAFGLQKEEIERLILGLQLYDLGLRDGALRQLVIDLIRRSAPAPVREKARRLYRSYTDLS